MEESSVHLFQSRRVRGATILVLLLLSVFLFAQSLIAFRQYGYVGRDIPSMHTITVVGEGEVFVRPDTAKITYRVEAEAPTTEEAEKQATETAGGVLEFVRAQGVDEADIRTLSYNLNPRYESASITCIQAPCPTPRRELVGYVVAQTIELSVPLEGVEEIDLGKLVAGLAERNVTNITGPQFEIDDEEVYRTEARSQAIADAQEKAEILADDLEVTLVRLVNFNESGNAIPMYARSMMFDSAEGMGGELAVAPELPTGENQIVSQVMLVYEIR